MVTQSAYFPETYSELMTVSVPEGELRGVEVKRLTVTGRETASLRFAAQGRACVPGTYTVLHADGQLLMSDTTAERFDHRSAVSAISSFEARRVLINGLGLGMVLQAALSCEHVEHVDVVEVDERIINLVGPHYQGDPRVRICHADAFEQARRWPRGTRWDVVWHDIWPTICADNLGEMTRLHRSYGHRARWQGSWCRFECERARDCF